MSNDSYSQPHPQQPFTQPQAYESPECEDIEKRRPFESIRPVPQSYDSQDASDTSLPVWQTGFIARFPWLGLGALFTILICSAAAIVVLVTSDGKSQRHWPHLIRPSVLLSILNNIANICFGIAITNGVAIAWWRKTLNGTTIEQLHKSWTFSSSVKDAVLAGRAFNFIALAALTAKLTVIDGTLMQSATDTYIAADPGVNATFIGSGSEAIPVTGHLLSIGLPKDMFDPLRKNLAVWAQNPQQLPLNTFWGCNGRCFFKVPAAGFEFDCITTTRAVRVPNNPNQAIYTKNGTDTGQTEHWNNVLLYNVTFSSTSWDIGNASVWDQNSPQYRINHNQIYPSNMTMNVVYTDLGGASSDENAFCSGTETTHSCVLRPAVVNYPVLVVNSNVSDAKHGTSNTYNMEGVWVGITEDSYSVSGFDAPGYDPSKTQQDGFRVLRTETVNDSYISDDNTGTLSQLPALVEAFSTYLGGSATLESNASDNYGWGLELDGNAVMYQTVNETSTWECEHHFKDPLDSDRQAIHLQSLVASINQIMFALSTNVAQAQGITFNKSTSDNGELDMIPNGNVFNAADPKTYKTYTGTMYRESIHYKTHYAYMAGAIASTLFCVLCVLPTYWGYWQLGRKVTLGPCEIAHAFRSPMTAQAANGTVEEIIEKVGQREVKYGHIVAGTAEGVLGIAEPEYVAKMNASRANEFSPKVRFPFFKSSTQ